MANTITTKGSIVTAWVDACDALLPSASSGIMRLIATPQIQPLVRTITAASGVNLTLSSTLGLFPGTRIKLVVTSGTQPPQATPGYTFQVKSVSGSTITVAHDAAAPAIDWGFSVTASWQVEDDELTIVSPVAQWNYYAYALRDMVLSVNTKYLTVSRNIVNTSIKTQDINYTRGSFARSTGVGMPATYTIKHFGLVEMDSATNPTNIVNVIHQVTLDTPVVLTGTITTSLNVSLASGFILT